VEFSDELSALGVRVDELDSRVAVLEKDLGGWSIAGEFRFDWNMVNNDSGVVNNNGQEQGSIYGVSGKTDFNLNRYRIWLRKRIDEKVSFEARLGTGGPNNSGDAPGVIWDYYFITAKLGWDITMHAGRLNFDWEADQGFVEPGANDSWFGDLDLQAFHFKKDWGIANLELVVGRLSDDGANRGWEFDDDLDHPGVDWDDEDYEYYLVSALANFDFNEKFRGGAMGYFAWSDYEPWRTPYNPYATPPTPPVTADGRLPGDDFYTVGIYAGFKFHPSVELKGIYYFSGWDDDTPGVDDSGNAWKAILDIDQDLLKFTSLWLEYGQIDNNVLGGVMDGVIGHNDADFYRGAGPDWSGGFPGRRDGTSKGFIVNTQQKWNDKWSTYLRYAHWDFDGGTNTNDTADEWTIAAKYQYTDALSFELSYDNVSWDDVAGAEDSDHLIRFRTFVAF
jgi:hypothetical protein